MKFILRFKNVRGLLLLDLTCFVFGRPLSKNGICLGFFSWGGGGTYLLVIFQQSWRGLPDSYLHTKYTKWISEDAKKFREIFSRWSESPKHTYLRWNQTKWKIPPPKGRNAIIANWHLHGDIIWRFISLPCIREWGLNATNVITKRPRKWESINIIWVCMKGNSWSVIDVIDSFQFWAGKVTLPDINQLNTKISDINAQTARKHLQTCLR